MRSGIAELGERGSLYYHLACLEARSRQLDEAKKHLSRALELDPGLAEQAAADDDLKELL